MTERAVPAAGWANEEVFHLMRRVMQRHHALWRDRLPGLTPVQYGVLLSLEHLPGADQRTIGAIAAVEPTTMANLIARMEAGGLVVREADPSDGRRYQLTLSPAGRQALRVATPIANAIRDDLLSTVSSRDASQLRRILTAMEQPGATPRAASPVEKPAKNPVS